MARNIDQNATMAEVIGLGVLGMPLVGLLLLDFSNEPVDFVLVQRVAYFIVGSVLFFFALQRITVPGWQLISAKNLVMAGVLVVVLSDALQMIPAMSRISPATALRVEILISLFLVTLQFGYTLPILQRLPRKLTTIGDPILPGGYLFLLIVAFILALVSYLYFTNWSVSALMAELLKPRFAASWSRGTLGDTTIFIRSLSFFRMIVPALAAVYVVSAFRNQSNRAGILIAILLSASMLAFEFFQGDRRNFVFIAAAPLLVLIVTARTARARRIRVLLAILGITIILLATNLQLAIRGAGIVDTLEQGRLTRTLDRFYADANFVHFGTITDLVPTVYDYIYFDEILYVISLPIPRFLWPSKPVGFGWTYVHWIRVTTSSVSFSALAEFYVSFGVFGVMIGGALYGLLCRLVDRLRPAIQDSDFMAGLFALSSMVLFMGIRSLREIVLFGIYVALFVGLILLGNRLLNQKTRAKSGARYPQAVRQRQIVRSRAGSPANK